MEKMQKKQVQIKSMQKIFTIYMVIILSAAIFLILFLQPFLEETISLQKSWYSGFYDVSTSHSSVLPELKISDSLWLLCPLSVNLCSVVVFCDGLHFL